MIKTWDVCRVVSRKKVDQSGLNVADIVMVSAIKPAPIKKNDPYLQRIYVLVMKIAEGGIQIPSEDNDYRAYLVDPRALEVLNEDETLFYKGLIQNQFGGQ